MWLPTPTVTNFNMSWKVIIIHTGAVYRYFESRRRIYNDSLPHRKDAVTTNRKKAQKEGMPD